MSPGPRDAHEAPVSDEGTGEPEPETEPETATEPEPETEPETEPPTDDQLVERVAAVERERDGLCDANGECDRLTAECDSAESKHAVCAAAVAKAQDQFDEDVKAKPKLVKAIEAQRVEDLHLARAHRRSQRAKEAAAAADARWRAARAELATAEIKRAVSDLSDVEEMLANSYRRLMDAWVAHRDFLRRVRQCDEEYYDATGARLVGRTASFNDAGEPVNAAGERLVSVVRSPRSMNDVRFKTHARLTAERDALRQDDESFDVKAWQAAYHFATGRA